MLLRGLFSRFGDQGLLSLSCAAFSWRGRSCGGGGLSTWDVQPSHGEDPPVAGRGLSVGCAAFSWRGPSCGGAWALYMGCAAVSWRGRSCSGARALGAGGELGSVAVAPGFWSPGSVVVAHRLSCSLVCAIFLDQALNPPLLRWQAGSFPLSHQGRPPPFVFLTGTFSSLTSVMT